MIVYATSKKKQNKTTAFQKEHRNHTNINTMDSASSESPNWFCWEEAYNITKTQITSNIWIEINIAKIGQFRLTYNYDYTVYPCKNNQRNPHFCSSLIDISSSLSRWCPLFSTLLIVLKHRIESGKQITGFLFEDWCRRWLLINDRLIWIESAFFLDFMLPMLWCSFCLWVFKLGSLKWTTSPIAIANQSVVVLEIQPINDPSHLADLMGRNLFSFDIHRFQSQIWHGDFWKKLESRCRVREHKYIGSSAFTLQIDVRTMDKEICPDWKIFMSFYT